MTTGGLDLELQEIGLALDPMSSWQLDIANQQKIWDQWDDNEVRDSEDEKDWKKWKAGHPFHNDWAASTLEADDISQLSPSAPD